MHFAITWSVARFLAVKANVAGRLSLSRFMSTRGLTSWVLRRRQKGATAIEEVVAAGDVLIAPDNLVYAIDAPCLGGAGEGGGMVEGVGY